MRQPQSGVSRQGLTDARRRRTCGQCLDQWILIGLRRSSTPISGSILGAIAVLCYLRAPVAHDMSNNQLSVVFRLGGKMFEPLDALMWEGA